MSADAAGKNIDRYVVRGDQRPAGVTIHHPLNPNSELYIASLSEAVGLKRAQLHYAILPPGKESFIPHAHAAQEEFIFILSGEATLLINDEETTLKAGDYAGFPTDGAAHQVVNSGAVDLVYLMGGERTDVEIVHFPEHKKTGYWRDGTMHYVSDDAALTMKPEDFVVPPSDNAAKQDES